MTTPAAASTGARGRSKVTVAVPFPVHPPVGGGQHRVFCLYRAIARDFDVELVTLADSDATFGDDEIAPGLREVRVPKSPRHQAEEARITQEVSGVPVGDIGIPLFARLTPEYGRQLARSLETAAAAVASHPYSLPAMREALGDRPLVYEAHNVEYLLKKEVLRNSGSVGTELAETVRALEAEACRASRLVLCCSENDRDELCRLYGLDAARTVIAPNGVDVAAVPFTAPAGRSRLKAALGLADQRIGVFVGSWHQPNLEAAEALLEIARATPSVKFLLVGSQCLPLAHVPRPVNVGLMGVVDAETLACLLAAADVALNPMLGGSGTNLKLATYLAAGLPAVTTPVGARGYDLVDGQHGLIRRLEDFPAGIASVLGDAALAERLARQGRRLVERRHDWTFIASTVASALRALLHRPVQTPPPLDDLVGRVSGEIAALGIPEHHALVRQVAAAVAELGLSGPRPDR